MSYDAAHRAAYELLAARYAVKNAVMSPGELAAAQRLVARLKPGCRLLDAGCGAGRDMAWFESHDIAVTGVDQSPAMLAEARTRVRGELRERGLGQLDFADGTFDAVWCNAVLLHFPKASVHLAVRELRRVAKAGAHAVFSMKAGTGEAWEPGYETTVERFFARYSAEEFRPVLEGGRFEVDAVSAAIGSTQTWLTFETRAVSVAPENSPEL